MKSWIVGRPRPFSQRPMDWLLVVFLVFFTFTSFCIDLPQALYHHWGIPVPPALLQLVAEYQVNTDPVFAVMPPYLLAALSLSALLWGPLYLWFIHGFITGNSAIRTPVLVYSGAMASAMVIVMSESLFSTVPGWRSPDPEGFLAVNLPYLVVPLLLLWRMLPERTFDN